MVLDEFIVNTPREKSKTAQSPTLKVLIPQATPQALTRATDGGRSFLQEAFGGRICPPRQIDQLIGSREFTRAQLACDQACKLSLMSLTAYREHIRNDLRTMVPTGMDVIFVQSRIITMVAHLTRSQVDMVPVDFADVLLMYLLQLNLSDASIAAVRSATEVSVSPRELVGVIRGLESRYGESCAASPCTQRAVERIEECIAECPICYNAAGAESAPISIMGCCGYIICGSCARHLSKCAFCRKDIPMRTLRTDEIDATDATEAQRNGGAANSYPASPVFSSGRTFEEDIAQYTSDSNAQMRNLTLVMHVLKRHGYVRPIIVVERSRYQSSSASAASFLCATSMELATGYRVVRIDSQLSGKGSAFAKVKDRFDDSSEPPMAMCCFGMDSAFLVGTDLAHADSLVVVGHIYDQVVTQALGRIMRPLAGRRNNRIQLVKVYSGAHSIRRRARHAH